MGSEGSVSRGRVVEEDNIRAPQAVFFRAVDIEDSMVSARGVIEIDLAAVTIKGFTADEREGVPLPALAPLVKSMPLKSPD